MSENTKSVLSLTLICLFVSTAVAFSYKITKPHIERSANEAAYTAMESVLPQSQGFEEIDVSKEILEEYSCTFLRRSVDTGAVAVQIETKGYQPGLVVMVGVDTDGKITGVKVVQHAETEGIGTRAMTEDYLSKYRGEPDVKDTELISGATYTSNGIKNAVKNAVSLFNTIKGELKGEG